MTEQDDVLKELDAALQIEPSRAFADGVRARVTRSHSKTRNMWWGLAAAASVALATVALWRPSVETPTALPAAPSQAAVTTQPDATTIPDVTPARVVAMEKAAPVASRPVTPVARVAVMSVSEPRLEVITNQGAVLRQLWARYDGQLVPFVAEAEKVLGSPATTPIVVEPIVVPPIVVSEIGSEASRAGATPIIRRADATKETR